MRASVAILLLVASVGAPAQELGTLFHSPAERATLERLRRGETPQQALAAPRDPVVTGFVKRSDGKSTVFIDKQPYAARDPRMQDVIEPRIIERYEPVPLPAESPAIAPPESSERNPESKPPPQSVPAKKVPSSKPKAEVDD